MLVDGKRQSDRSSIFSKKSSYVGVYCSNLSVCAMLDLENKIETNYAAVHMLNMYDASQNCTTIKFTDIKLTIAGNVLFDLTI